MTTTKRLKERERERERSLDEVQRYQCIKDTVHGQHYTNLMC